jgi:hypothetical protein
MAPHEEARWMPGFVSIEFTACLLRLKTFKRLKLITVVSLMGGIYPSNKQRLIF